MHLGIRFSVCAGHMLETGLSLCMESKATCCDVQGMIAEIAWVRAIIKNMTVDVGVTHKWCCPHESLLVCSSVA